MSGTAVTTAVIIVAAGRGQRFGGEIPKQYLMLGGQPVVRHCVAAFARHPGIDIIQPVIHPDDAATLKGALDGFAYAPPVAGGASRQRSVLNGLRALAALPVPPDYVLVHDAARPYVPEDLLQRVLDALQTVPGAIPALAVVDTLKRAGDDAMIAETVPRDGLWRAQTPQGFRFQDLLAAHENAPDGLTDDAAVMEAASAAVILVDGSENNIKVTTPEDLARMEGIMGGTETPSMRIGKGFDVHKIGPGDGVQLCGVTIASDLALIGHSDADVALHALTDAILGAIADGDIGSHFPPSDAKWKGADSEMFLAPACDLMKAAGYGLSNIDLTVICEAPKVGPHRDAMRANVARILGVDVAQISVKATTTEKLGFTGRGEGIAAEAVVLLHACR